MAEKKNIFETITAVMDDIGYIGKGDLNKQQGFKYRGIDAVMNALNPAFIKHHLFIVPEVMEQRREERQTAKGGNLIYSVCRVKYTFYAEDGSSIEAVVVGEGMDSGDKASNKALAVAFKYACFQVFCIPTEEMKDPDEESHEPSTSRRPVLVDDVHISTLFTELSRTGIGRNQMLKNYGITDIHEMTMEQFRDAMNILKGKPDKPLDPATVPPDDMDGRMPWNTPTR